MGVKYGYMQCSLDSDYSSSSNLWILFKLAVTFFAMPLPRPEEPQALLNYPYACLPHPALPAQTTSPWLTLVCQRGRGTLLESPLKHFNFSFSLRSWLKKNVSKQSWCACCLLKTKSSSSQSFTKILNSSNLQCPFKES